MAGLFPVDITGGDLGALTTEEKAQLLEEVRMSRGILHTQQHRVPYIPTFNGESKSIDYMYWKALVQNLTLTHKDQAILQAIRKSLTGQPAQIVGNIGIACSLADVFSALDIAYDSVKDSATAWHEFYAAKQLQKETIIEWHTRLHKLWSQIPEPGSPDLHIKKKVWTGLYSESTKESSRHMYDNDDVSEAKFIKYLRQLIDSKTPATKSCNSLQPNDNPVDQLKSQVAALTSQLDRMRTTEHQSDKQPQKQTAIQQNNPPRWRQNSSPRWQQNNSPRWQQPQYDRPRHPHSYGYDYHPQPQYPSQFQPQYPQQFNQQYPAQYQQRPRYQGSSPRGHHSLN